MEEYQQFSPPYFKTAVPGVPGTAFEKTQGISSMQTMYLGFSVSGAIDRSCPPPAWQNAVCLSRRRATDAIVPSFTPYYFPRGPQPPPRGHDPSPFSLIHGSSIGNAAQDKRQVSNSPRLVPHHLVVLYFSCLCY